MGAANFDDIDPVAAIMEHALQMARNDIEEITGYDFMNDFAGTGSEVYTAGNYMCSSFDA